MPQIDEKDLSGTTNNTTPVDMTPVPPSATQHIVVTSIEIHNTDNIDHFVRIFKVDSSGTRRITRLKMVPNASVAPGRLVINLADTAAKLQIVLEGAATTQLDWNVSYYLAGE